MCQHESFPEYFDSKDSQMKKSKLFKLFSFKDDQGLLRVKGRLGKSRTATIAAQHLIILEPKNQYTKLLLQHLHEKALHQGQGTVLNNLREHYWVLHGRAAVKSTFAHCQWCKIQKSRPVAPEMASLPSFRVTAQSGPFAVTGVDYFGSMEVTIGRRHAKRWGVLFTCPTVRAIHIELASSLSTDFCIQALRSFISRRGAPNKIWSDNGTNFKGASTELQKALMDLDRDWIRTNRVKLGIDWNFIPLYAPHMGGCWERLIGSVKRALKAVLNERAPEEL